MAHHIKSSERDFVCPSVPKREGGERVKRKLAPSLTQGSGNCDEMKKLCQGKRLALDKSSWSRDRAAKNAWGIDFWAAVAYGSRMAELDARWDSGKRSFFDTAKTDGSIWTIYYVYSCRSPLCSGQTDRQKAKEIQRCSQCIHSEKNIFIPPAHCYIKSRKRFFLQFIFSQCVWPSQEWMHGKKISSRTAEFLFWPSARR